MTTISETPPPALAARTGAGSLPAAPEAPRADPAEGPGTGGALSSDFETFLRMLTVQMQNQDPLNPAEASDFAVQLATFSGVEQQVLTNELLRASGLASAQGERLADYSDWIGMHARSAAPVPAGGAPVTIEPQPHPAADTAVLVVRDAQGQILHETPLALPAQPLDRGVAVVLDSGTAIETGDVTGVRDQPAL